METANLLAIEDFDEALWKHFNIRFHEIKSLYKIFQKIKFITDRPILFLGEMIVETQHFFLALIGFPNDDLCNSCK